MNYLVGVLLMVVLFKGSLQCPNGWTEEGDSCYLLIKEKYTFFDAMATCKTVGARLVEIDTADKNQVVQRLLSSHQSASAWIGAEDIIVEGSWVWAGSQAPIAYHNWANSEPNNYGGSEDCAVIGSNGNWYDATCEVGHLDFVCERTASAGDVIG